MPGGQQGRVRPPDARTEAQHQHERPFLPSWNLRTNNGAADRCRRHGHCVLAAPDGEKSKYSQSGVPDCSGDGSFTTEDCVVGEGEPRQRALALRIDLPPCWKRWSEPPGEKKKKKKSLQFWHLVEFHQGKGLIHVWLNLVFSSVDWDFLLQQEPTAFRAAEIMERLASVAAWQKNRNQGHQHFGVQ